MSQPGDEELLARHLGGDPTAFGTLVARHERRVYAICLRLLGNPEDAEDAAQETFIAVLRRAGTFTGGSAFTTWLYRVAVNAAIDLGRRRARARAVPLDGQVAAVRADGAPDPGEVASAAVTVQAALTRLPEEFRAAVVLCDLCRLSYPEAAEVLDVPVGTVKSRVFRGRAALAAELRALDPRGRAASGVVRPVEPGTVDRLRSSEGPEHERRQQAPS